MRICGIDPGLNVTGYGVLDCDGPRASVVDAGVIRTDDRAGLARRIAQIADDVQDLLRDTCPDVVAVEELYAHYKHPRTAILMGHARGVVLAEVARQGLEVRSYSATQIKRFLTGNGRASKSQMQRAIVNTLALPEIPDPPDVADALAVALCGAFDVARTDRLAVAKG